MIKCMIVIVNYNGWRDTTHLLSILNVICDQSKYTLKIKVVDNKSNDDSVFFIKSLFCETDITESKRNGGFGYGNNIAIREALLHGFDYVWLINNDAELEVNSVDKMLDYIIENNKLGIVGSTLFDFNQRDIVQASGGGTVNYLIGTSKHNLVPNRIDYVTGASMLISLKCIEEIGLFDENIFMYWEDVDLCVRAKKHGWGIGIVHNSKIWHKENSSLGKNSQFLNYVFNQSFVYFFLKHSYYPLLPITIGLSGRVFKRLMTFKFNHITMIVKGAVSGFSNYKNYRRQTLKRKII